MFEPVARLTGSRRSWAAVVLVLAVGMADATPTRDGKNKGTIQWAKDSVIDVYIPPDPDGKGRDASLRDGMLAWNGTDALTSRNIKIDVHLGVPPTGKNATNSVIVTWQPAGAIPGNELGSAGPSYKRSEGNKGLGGKIDIDRDTTDVDNQMARNLGTHEMGHILGLTDVTTKGSAMNPGFKKTDQLTITDDDKTELRAVYAANKQDTQVDMQVSVTPAGPGFRYTYTSTWLGGDGLAVFQVDTHGADVSDITAASGWRIDDFALGPDEQLFPLDTSDEVFLGFVHQDEELYLDANHPVAVFSFLSSRPPGATEAFLNGRFETIGPAAVPAPATLGLALLGLGLLGVRAHRIRFASDEASAT